MNWTVISQSRTRLAMSTASSLRLSLLVLVFLGAAQVECQVAGMLHTRNGYDRLGGTDALCWWAPSFHDHEAHDHSDHDKHNDSLIEDFEGKRWENSMIPDFQSGPTTLLGECPGATAMHIDIFREQVAGSHILRTNRYYTYHIEAVIDLGAIRLEYGLSEDSFFTSEDGVPRVGFRIEFCPVRTIGCKREGIFPTPITDENILSCRLRAIFVAPLRPRKSR